jgi:hypothetical protein
MTGIPVWSRLTRGQRILVAAVVVVVGLFVASVATGGRRGGGSAAEQSAPLAWLGDVLSSAVAVDPADVRSDCLDPPSLFTVDGSCVVRVAPADADLRTLTLRTRDPLSVSAPVPGTDEVATSELDAGGSVTVAVDADGADIELECGDVDPCVVARS